MSFWSRRDGDDAVERTDTAMVSAERAVLLAASEVLADAERAARREVRGWVLSANRNRVPVASVDVTAGRVRLHDGTAIVLGNPLGLEAVALAFLAGPVYPCGVLGRPGGVWLWFESGGDRLRVDGDGVIVAS